MCRLLDVEPGMRVLEVGTGSGYSGALLGRLTGPTGRVTSLDVDASLIQRAGAKHAEHGIDNVTVHLADGFAGWAADTPYHRIIAWATPHLLPGPGCGRPPTTRGS